MEYELTVCECGIYDCAPDWKIEQDGFSDYDLWVVLRGDGKLILDGVSHRITAGTAVIMPPGCSIRGYQDQNARLFVLAVHFNTGSAALEKQLRPAVPRAIINLPFFKELTERVIFSHNAQSAATSVWLAATINEYLSSPPEAENGLTSREHVKCINEICESINSSIASAKSLAEYAADYGYSPTYLSKLFHRAAGLSFSQYVLNTRINQAKLLLKTSDMSISDIATTLGYCDASHFVRQFKKAIGCSPSSYR